MNDFRLVRTLYPEPRPLADSDRASMRSELFGSTATIAHRPASDEHGAIDETSTTVAGDLQFAAGADTNTGSGRGRLTVAAAAVVIAGLAGVWAVGSRNGDEVPAPLQQPTTAVPNEVTDTSQVGVQRAQPTAFPVLEELPTGLSATARVDQLGEASTGPRTQALIGRRVDGLLTDAVAIAVLSEPAIITRTQGRTPTETVIMGQPASVYDESYSEHTVFTVTWGSGPYFIAQGEAPLGLLGRAASDAIEATISADEDEPPQVTIGTLPDDFEVIVRPHPIAGDGIVSATLSIGPDRYDVSVNTVNPLVGMASAGEPLRSIDINGQPGWTYSSSSETQDITWQVNDSTYAYLSVGDGSTAPDAIAIASKITFVDFDTWTNRYSPDLAELAAATTTADS